jgi:hypothetical protein
VGRVVRGERADPGALLGGRHARQQLRLINRRQRQEEVARVLARQELKREGAIGA